MLKNVKNIHNANKLALVWMIDMCHQKSIVVISEM